VRRKFSGKRSEASWICCISLQKNSGKDFLKSDGDQVLGVFIAVCGKPCDGWVAKCFFCKSQRVMCLVCLVCRATFALVERESNVVEHWEWI
jgi:hypothetical protein